MNPILSHLNPRQQEAVTYQGGPLLILAGAGSGKTRVLTYRITYFITDKKINPENILALTFTNKAAGEMKERIKTLLTSHPHNSQPILTPFSGTFHSFCAKILRREGTSLGLSQNYLIFDEEDQKEAIKEAMRRLNLSSKDLSPGAILSTISQAKNEMIAPVGYLEIARGYFQEQVAKIYRQYQEILKASSALDFDDLLLFCVKLFEKYPLVLEKYQNKFRYLLVDEWQDTNKVQYRLIRLMTKNHQNLTVVGDAAQSIYGWRGADFRNILYLQRDFPKIKVINLEQNYRSTQTILDAAYEVIKHNRSHPILKLWTENASGEKITIYESQNESDEANFIIKAICGTHRLLSDFAVLYRTNAQSRVIEEAFLHAGLPYQLVGGVKFYSRKEIKDVLAYLRLLINREDLISYKRIEKLGKGRLKRFLDFNENFQNRNLTTLEILDEVLAKTGYLEKYDEHNEEDSARLENIRELRSVAAEFPTLVDFLENVALVQQESLPDSVPLTREDKKNVVTLMTAHAAKGLEYPIVFIVGMEEGLFPHSRSLLDAGEIEEERRLCYVGITRAKEKLYLSYASRRLYFGQRSSNMISRFIADIPEYLIEYQNSGILIE